VASSHQVPLPANNAQAILGEVNPTRPANWRNKCDGWLEASGVLLGIDMVLRSWVRHAFASSVSYVRLAELSMVHRGGLAA
jgi:hypothetical protein